MRDCDYERVRDADADADATTRHSRVRLLLLSLAAAAVLAAALSQPAPTRQARLPTLELLAANAFFLRAARIRDTRDGDGDANAKKPAQLADTALCMRRAHLDAPFLVHQELQDGPRFVREELLAHEAVRSAAEFFTIAWERSTNREGEEESETLALLRHNPQEQRANPLNEFGPVIARLPLVKHALLPASEADSLCFRAIRLFQAVTPLVISRNQWTLLNTPDDEQNDTNTAPQHQFAAHAGHENTPPDAQVAVLAIKAFPRNTLVLAEWVDAAEGTWSLVSSIALLPSTAMEKRKASDHVGYFVSYETSRDDVLPRAERFIYRYRLDASTRRQILFYIDPSVPKRWHEVIRAGVAAWNQAFHGIFSDPEAAVVRCVAPGEPEFPADFHAADIRYNVLLWFPVDKEGYSVTHSIVDPRSGEVLSSKIFIDSGLVIEILNTFAFARVRVPEVGGMGFSRGGQVQPASASAAHSSLRGSLNESNVREQPKGTAEQSPAWDALERCVQMVISHEVGHALGLRHNFLGSTQNSRAQNGDREFTELRGLSSSLMDYLPVNIRSSSNASNGASDAVENQMLCQTSLGRYDKWAIAYGYTPDLDAVALARLASQRLPFATDEDEIANLSFAQKFDLGDDPLEFFRDRLDLIANAQTNLEEVASATHFIDHDGSERLWAVEKELVRATAKVLSGAAKFVGGRRSMWDAVGERTRITRVERRLQEEALRVVLEVVSLCREDVLPRREFFDAFLEKDEDGCGTQKVFCYGGQRADARRFLLDSVLSPSLVLLLDAGRLENVLVDEEEGAANSTLTLSTLLECSLQYIWRLDAASWKCPLAPRKTAAQMPVYSSALLRSVQQQHLSLLVQLASSSSNSSVLLADSALLAIGRLEREVHSKLRTSLARSNGSIEVDALQHEAELERLYLRSVLQQVVLSR